MYRPMLATLLLLGCVKTTVPNSLAPTLEVEQIDVSRGGAAATFKVGDTLRPGDEIALTVTLDKPAYVYVAQSAADRPTALLYPTGGVDVRLISAGRSRIPEAGFISLSALQPGQLLCIAAATKLPQTLPSCASGSLVFASRGSEDPPPPDKSDGQRGDPKVKTLRLPVASP